MSTSFSRGSRHSEITHRAGDDGNSPFEVERESMPFYLSVKNNAWPSASPANKGNRSGKESLAALMAVTDAVKQPPRKPTR
jgi:hypothetical protein